MTRFLRNSELDSELATLGGWHRSGHELRRVYPAGGHREAMDFAAGAARLVGQAGHEPVFGVQVHGRFVYLTLYSPDYGGITDADVRLARRLGALASGRLRPPGPGGDGGGEMAPYADLMGAPEPAEEETDVFGGPEPAEDETVMGRGEPAEERTDVMGRAEPAEERTDVMGRAEPSEEETDIMGGPEGRRGRG